MSKILCLFSVLCLGVVLGYPSKHATHQRAAFASNPLFRRSYNFVPQGARSEQDVVATDAYAEGYPQADPAAAGQVPFEGNEYAEQYAEGAAAPQDAPQPEVVPQEEVPAPAVAVAEEAPVYAPEEDLSKRVPKAQEDDDDDDDDASSNSGFPFKAAKGVTSYNAFFPITIKESSRYRARAGAEGSYPGSATAIANSFSTGRRGVANSHATSFGDPHLGEALRKGLFKPEA